ncbi:UNKNOWN [Stylonychia lemnae]|uniref:Uncharacterized protein n=1 Tax=Stylonychia lemnae TaxID=5949 RepID=A0A078A1A2_STYLE|nr:UNKNOWN [Stylonychia lemnae]|eukprot:CDW75627.1 UNKNOWN [Stylonychia lemnae]
MQNLLSQNQGKIMHTKTFIQKHNDGKTTAQIRCYFSYNKQNIKTKEEWIQFVYGILGEYLENTPSFVEMMPIFITSQQSNLSYSQTQQTQLQNLIQSSTSAPNLHLATNLIHQPLFHNIQNDTFAEQKHQNELVLDSSNSVFTLSQDQSQIQQFQIFTGNNKQQGNQIMVNNFNMGNSNNSNHKNFKLISSLIKQQLQCYTNQVINTSQSKDTSYSILQITNKDISKDFLKQSSFLSQLQELNSSQEDGEETLNQKQLQLSYLDNIGASLVSIEQDQQHDEDNFNTLPDYNNIEITQKLLNGRIITNQSQSYIDFDPESAPKQSQIELLIQENNQLKNENQKLRKQIQQQKCGFQQSDKLDISLLIGEKIKIRQEQQVRIEEQMISLHEKLEEQKEYLQSSIFDTSQISMLSEDLIQNNDEEKLEELKKLQSQINEQQMTIEQLQKQIEDEKLSKDNNIVNQLLILLDKKDSIDLTDKRTNLILTVNRVNKQVGVLKYQDKKRNKLRLLCDRKNDENSNIINLPHIKERSQSDVEQLLKKQSNIQLLSQKASPDLRRTRTLVSLDLIDTVSTNIFDDYDTGSNQIQDQIHLVPIQEEDQLIERINFSTNASTEGIRTAR